MLTYIALGSNLGDRVLNFQQARDSLRALDLFSSFRQSSIYETLPISCADGSPDFLNAVVAFDYRGSMHELLNATQAIENQLGRVRLGVNSPRTIDIDILAHGEQIIAEERLQIPHPRMHERRFVIEPICDIDPMYVIPGLPVNAASYLALLKESQTINKFTSNW